MVSTTKTKQKAILIKKITGKKNYILRSQKLVSSKSDNAIKKQRFRLKGVNKGDLDFHRWTIKRNVWDEKSLNTTLRMLSKLNKVSEGARYAVRGDNNRLLIPEEYMSKKVTEYTSKFTRQLNLGFPRSKIQVLISRCGSTKQSFHRDHNENDVYSVLHAITKRYIWLRDSRGIHYVELRRGDILLMHGNCCHAGAANDAKRVSYAMHVPVGYKSNFTFNCDNYIP